MVTACVLIFSLQSFHYDHKMFIWCLYTVFQTHLQLLITVKLFTVIINTQVWPANVLVALPVPFSLRLEPNLAEALI